ncbi:MAG: hypothetical protein EP335_15795 [Alphaproteobacteria bacterium]|nr:MAG: hypothetical protein EP335_15795 [Alphaproteobacteria bacterium]
MRMAEARPGQGFVLALHEDLVARMRENPRWAALATANVTLVPIPDATARLVKPNNKDIPGGLRMISHALDIARTHGCGHIHFLHLDTVILALFVRSFLPTPVTISGMYMCPTEHYAAMFGSELSRGERLFAWVKKRVVSRLLSWRRLTAIHSLDEHVAGYYGGHAKAYKMLPTPDFGPIPDIERQPEGFDAWLKAPKRFALFGAIEARKGIFPLLTALARLDPAVADTVGVAFMGRVPAPVRTELDAAIARVRAARPGLVIALEDRFVDDEEILWLCRHSRAILMPYQRHRGSSSVLGWAAHSGLPVLAQSFGVIGHEVRTNGLGLAVDTGNPDAIADALVRLCEPLDPAWRENLLAYAVEHNQATFADKTFNGLKPKPAAAHT